MPRLTKKQLAEVKYVSMADYYNQVGQYEDFNDKLKFTTKYLLTHSAAQNPDYPIEQAIHLAKVRLIDDAVKKHDDYMKKNKWGRIINISSTNSMNTYYPMGLEYDASKAALNSLTHNLAIQFAPFITVNAVAPGFIGTEAELKDYDEEFLKEEIDKILVKRIGKVEDVSKVVKFLASDDASYINNSIIRIDGGQFNSF